MINYKKNKYVDFIMACSDLGILKDGIKILEDIEGIKIKDLEDAVDFLIYKLEIECKFLRNEINKLNVIDK